MVRPLTQLIDSLREARSLMASAELTEALAERAPRNGGGSEGRPLVSAALVFNRGLKQLDRWGVVVRDLDSGICDLTGTRAGEDVYLCWRYGEGEIAHWHRQDAGFAGRRPIDDLIDR